LKTVNASKAPHRFSPAKTIYERKEPTPPINHGDYPAHSLSNMVANF